MRFFKAVFSKCVWSWKSERTIILWPRNKDNNGTAWARRSESVASFSPCAQMNVTKEEAGTRTVQKRLQLFCHNLLSSWKCYFNVIKHFMYRMGHGGLAVVRIDARRLLTARTPSLSWESPVLDTSVYWFRPTVQMHDVGLKWDIKWDCACYRK